MNPTLAKLIIGQIFLHACMAGSRLAAPLMALKLGYSAVAVGVLLALFSLSAVFLALPAGRYIDRHPFQRPVGISVLVGVLGAAVAALAAYFGLDGAAAGGWLAAPMVQFAALCVAALCTGGATGTAVIAFQRYVGRAAADSLALKKAFGWLAVGPAISNFLGPLVAGLLIDHAGFYAAFAAMAAFPLICWYWVRDTPSLPVVAAPAAGARSSAWDLLRNPAMRRLLLVNWFLSSSWDVHTFVVPVLGHALDFNASTIGAILGAFAIAAAGVRMLIPLLAKHLREWAVVTGAMLMTAVLFGIYPLMHSAWTMGLCSVLLGLALGSVQPMIMSSLHHITPEHRQGEALGLRSMTVNGSSVLMPMLFGALSALVGVNVIFWGVGAVLGLGSRLAMGLQSHDAR
jgi:MFS family permease